MGLPAAPAVEAALQGCTTSDPCDPGAGGIGLTINCTGGLTVAPVSCGAGPGFGKSLLRVAVRCFDPGEPEQARYADRDGFDVNSGTWNLIDPDNPQDPIDLVSGCENFLAAAHWNRDGFQVQAQCVRVTDPALEVGDCEAPTGEEAADLSLYAAILPQWGDNSCTPDPDVNNDLSRVEIRNAAVDRGLPGHSRGPLHLHPVDERSGCLRRPGVDDPSPRPVR